ncbi:MAG: hypothetical protein U5K43_15640 [Halofilum sp. (in: g-proteobacteria)]|nr:hypothetical protein [Halofilum sp. (in: g-proteobacteria)]
MPPCHQYAAGNASGSQCALSTARDRQGDRHRCHPGTRRAPLAGRHGRTPRSALIDTAESMTTSAANSLLKTLEEPPGGSVLILASRRPARLPATVRSRCQRISFGLPAADAAAAWLGEQGVADPGTWLARAGGAPLTALALASAQAEGDEAALADAVADALLATLEHGLVPAGGTRPMLAPRWCRALRLVDTVEDLIRLVRMRAAAARLRRPDLRARMLPLAPAIGRARAVRLP